MKKNKKIFKPVRNKQCSVYYQIICSVNSHKFSHKIQLIEKQDGVEWNEQRIFTHRHNIHTANKS